MKNIKKKYQITAIAALLLTLILTFQSCCKPIQNEGELITTVSITIGTTGSAGTTYTWKDLDGIGGNDPILPDTIALSTITTGGDPYWAKLEFFNEQNGQKQDITLEIQNESHDHLICFDISSLTMPPTIGLNIVSTDQDKNGLPIGLTSSWKAKATDFGNVAIRLKHQAGIKNGTCTPGETDVEVSFPFRIK